MLGKKVSNINLWRGGHTKHTNIKTKKAWLMVKIFEAISVVKADKPTLDLPKYIKEEKFCL